MNPFLKPKHLHWPWIYVLGGLMLGLGMSCIERGDRPIAQPLSDVPSISLTSSAFASDAAIPQQYTCDGADQSPPLAWETSPENVQSWVLLVDDPDAPRRTFTHWVIYNIPAEQQSLEAAIAPEPTLPNGALQGRNDFGKTGYGGPCPPQGTHRYVFTLYALDTVLDLQPGADKTTLEQAMNGHILAMGQIVATYKRQ
jgi:Raf kinase inhibitor-like YbhB/YbcL family protein